MEPSSLRFFQMACVLKARPNAEFNCAGNLKKWPVFFKYKLNYTHTKIGAKVQSHQPSVLIVYPTPANVKELTI